MPTWQPQLPALVASSGESFTCLGQSFVQVLHHVPSRANDLHKLLRAAEFASACRLPIPALPNSSTAPVLVSLSPWWVFLRGLDSPSSSQCSSIICAADFPLTNLQSHKSMLPISPTAGMATSILRPWFGQPAEMCIPCTFDTVTLGMASFNGLVWHERELQGDQLLIHALDLNFWIKANPLHQLHWKDWLLSHKLWHPTID